MLRCVVPGVVSEQNLLTLPATATVDEAARAMTERKVRSVLITDGKKLCGIFTGTDLIERVVAAGKDATSTPLAEVMTKDPECVSCDCQAIEALRMMDIGGYRHLPVVDDGCLVGVLSRRDFVREEEDELEREQQIWEEM